MFLPCLTDVFRKARTYVLPAPPTKVELFSFPYFLSRAGIAQSVDSLPAGRSGDRIPLGARFSTPVQTDPGDHPASYTMDTVSFPGIKRPGRGFDHPPLSNAEVKERVELYLYTPSGPSWHVPG